MNSRTERTRITAGKGISRGLFALVALALMFATCPRVRAQTSSRSSSATEDAVFQAIDPNRNSGLPESLWRLGPTPCRITGIPVPEETSFWISYPREVTGSRPRIKSFNLQGRGRCIVNIIAFDQPEAAARFSETGGNQSNDYVRRVGERYAIWLRSWGFTSLQANEILDIFEGAMVGVLGSEQSEPPPSVAKGGEHTIDVQDELAAQPPVPPVSDDTTDPGVVSVEDTPIEDYEPTGEIPAAITALGSLATAAITALGAGLMMLGMGVTPREVVENLRDWVSGTSSNPEPATPALDPFESWKRDHESRGWRYSEKDGTARFDPVEGSLDERGWTYSESEGAFHPPQGGHEPPPLPDPAELRYREDVRLLQEDLERQRELLDRERQRLERYQDAGLDELLAGTRERIREHEKLAELSRSELERLRESVPEHRTQIHSDLQHDANERLRSRETIRELNESDRKLEAGSKALAEGDREIRQLEEEELMREKMTELEERMQSTINEKIQEGYYVRNSNLFKKAWNNSLGWAVEKAGGWKGGQCGEFGEWGADWSKKDVQALFGENAIVTDIAASNNPFLGHRATKVILPDGRRIVLDFWESLPEGKPKIYDEGQWIERWNDKLWGDTLGEVSINRHEDELNLKGLIKDWGEEAGKEKFRLYNAKKKGRDYAETFIRSWEKKPW